MWPPVNILKEICLSSFWAAGELTSLGFLDFLADLESPDHRVVYGHLLEEDQWSHWVGLEGSLSNVQTALKQFSDGSTIMGDTQRFLNEWHTPDVAATKVHTKWVNDERSNLLLLDEDERLTAHDEDNEDYSRAQSFIDKIRLEPEQENPSKDLTAFVSTRPGHEPKHLSLLSHSIPCTIWSWTFHVHDNIYTDNTTPSVLLVH